MIKPNIFTDILDALDIRVCEIKSAERVPKTDKLLKLSILTGEDERVAVTNIGSQFEPEQLIGKKYPFVLNLTPVTIRGIETFAMIVAVTGTDGKIELMECKSEIGSIIF